MAKKTDPLIPAQTPFAYNVGVNYESWEVGRTGYSISADLDQIAENFHLIRTYHAAAVGTTDPTTPSMDPTQSQVIDWIVKNPGNELVMGTNNSALAISGAGSTWTAGLMTSSAYTDLWVKMLIADFGSVAKVKIGLKAIELGNEIDQHGPPPTSASFSDYVDTWIPAAFDNLKASMAKYGLDSIPITTTIANYGVTNEVSVKIPAHIIANWGAKWNNGVPFVAFNQYTGDNQKSTDFSTVEAYFTAVQKAFGTTLEVFVGETGYSEDWGAANQQKVIKEMFAWLDGQESAGGKTVPLFVFDAFDRPAVTWPAGQVGFGIYGENGSYQPDGLKPGISVPSWVDDPITTATRGADSLYGTKAHETIKARAGDDIVLGLAGNDKLFGQTGWDLLVGHAGRDKLIGGRGDDYLDGSRGHDRLRGGLGDDTMIGGKGKDKMSGGKGADAFLFDFAMTKASAKKHWDKITDFDASQDTIHLKQSKVPDLALGELADPDGHVSYKHGALFYDDVKFAKFTDKTPDSLDDIDIIIYA